MSINKIEIQDGSGNVYYPKTSIDSVIYSDSTSIEEKIRILEYRLNELKSQLANSINNKTGSSLTSNSTVDEMTVAINSIKTLEQATADANATAGNILIDKTAYVNGAKITGTMPNKGAITTSLNCGGSYTIPAGYHNGSGKVTANSLSSQTSANATAGDILKDKTAWVNGSKLTGTIDNKGAITAGNSIVQSGDKLYCRMPRGAYLTNASSGYPEISYPQGDVAAALGLTANKIVAGNTIGGINGTATVDTMAKYVEADLSAVNVYTNADGTEEFKITTGFKPRFAMVNYFHSEYNKTILVLFNYTGDKFYGIGRKYNHSSTTTYDTSHVITVVSFVNDGVIVKASPYYRSKVSWIISQ